MLGHFLSYCSASRGPGLVLGLAFALLSALPETIFGCLWIPFTFRSFQGCASSMTSQSLDTGERRWPISVGQERLGCDGSLAVRECCGDDPHLSAAGRIPLLNWGQGRPRSSLGGGSLFLGLTKPLCAGMWCVVIVATRMYMYVAHAGLCSALGPSGLLRGVASASWSPPPPVGIVAIVARPCQPGVVGASRWRS